jgi:thioredoxin reductase (NADPH)
MPGGQLTTTTEVENYPGFENGIMGPDLMLTMEAQAKRFDTQVVVDTVVEADLSSRPFSLKTQNSEYTCDSLIISTGATPRFLGIDAEKELMGFGVSTCATCDGAFFRDKVITVVGGGDSACEEALFLTKFGSKVYLIHRRDELRASKIMAERTMNHEKIEILWNKKVKSVEGSKKDGVTSATLIDSNTGEESEIKTDAVFIAIGHIPNSSLFTGQIDQDSDGYLITKPDSTQTNIEGVFACGDVQDHTFRQAITAAGTGCMAAMEAERWLGA